MKRALLLALFFLCACHKDHPQLGQGWDGKQHAYDSCQSMTPHNSSGAIDPIPNNTQHIPTVGDVLTQPLNQLNVSICDASNNCKSTPSVYITYGHSEVVLHHAFDAQFVTWNISEVICGL
jgi:hypothetical protein